MVLKPRRNDFAAMLDGIIGLVSKVLSKYVYSCLLVNGAHLGMIIVPPKSQAPLGIR